MCKNTGIHDVELVYVLADVNALPQVEDLQVCTSPLSYWCMRPEATSV